MSFEDFVIVFVFIFGFAVGVGVGGCTVDESYRNAIPNIQNRAIESGDAQYHPTTGKFMFNGELEKNE